MYNVWYNLSEDALTERIIDFVRELIGNDYITTALISMIPIVELRGAIPAAMTMGIHPLLALALAWAGSALVSPILLLILQPVLNWMKKYKAFASLANAVESGFRSKALKVVGASDDEKLSPELMKKLEKKKMLGVYIFVAVPFPMTGVWTGSAISTFLDIPFWKSMFMVWLGNLTAGLIVTALAVFLQDYMNIVLDVFFIIVILVLLIYILRIVVKMVKNKKAAKEQAANAVDGQSTTTEEASQENVINVSGQNNVVSDGENSQKSEVDSCNISESDTSAKEDKKEVEAADAAYKKTRKSKKTSSHDENLLAPTSCNKKDGLSDEN